MTGWLYDRLAIRLAGDATDWLCRRLATSAVEVIDSERARYKAGQFELIFQYITPIFVVCDR